MIRDRLLFFWPWGLIVVGVVGTGIGRPSTYSEAIPGMIFFLVMVSMALTTIMIVQSLNKLATRVERLESQLSEFGTQRAATDVKPKA